MAIARALAMDPDILLADEPTGNQDTSSGGDIMGLFVELWEQGRTLLVNTPDSGIAAHAGRILRIVDGLIENETPAEGATA